MRDGRERRNRRQGLCPDPLVARPLCSLPPEVPLNLVAPHSRRGCYFGIVKISKTPVSSLSGAKRGVACSHARHGFPGRRRAKTWDWAVECCVSSQLRFRTGWRRQGSSGPGYLHARCLRLACCEACSCQSLPLSSHWPGPAARTTRVDTGSLRGPTEADGSPRTLPVSSRVYLDLENADEGGRLLGFRVRAGGKRWCPRGEGRAKHRSQNLLCRPSTERRPGRRQRVVFDVHPRRFVALRPCWASRAGPAVSTQL